MFAISISKTKAHSIYTSDVNVVNVTSQNGLALHVQHARDCNPCPSPHAGLPPALLVRRYHIHDPTYSTGHASKW